MYIAIDISIVLSRYMYNKYINTRKLYLSVGKFTRYWLSIKIIPMEAHAVQRAFYNIQLIYSFVSLLLCRYIDNKLLVVLFFHHISIYN